MGHTPDDPAATPGVPGVPVSLAFWLKVRRWSRTTGWRFRKRNWLKTTVVACRHYVYPYETFHTPAGKTIAVNLEDDTFRTGWAAADIGKATKETGTLAAITLATGLTKDSAIFWLVQNFGVARTGATLAQPANLHPPSVEPSVALVAVEKKCVVHSGDAWPVLKDQLTGNYGLSAAFLDEKNQEGIIGANEFGALVFQKQNATGEVVGGIVATDVPGYVHQFDPAPEERGIFKIGSLSAKTLFIVDTPFLALILHYCLQKFDQPNCCIVSLLDSSDPKDISQIMQGPQDVRLVLRLRESLILNHQKFVGVPSGAKTFHLGESDSKNDFFWAMIKKGYSGFEVLNEVSQKIFGRNVAPVIIPQDNAKPDWGDPEMK